MVKISPLLNPYLVETQFLPRFCELCSESMFHIRKVCATSIGDMCRIIGPYLAEKFMLPKFKTLCGDGIWGVRKACTECFMEVSNAVSPKARHEELAPLFVDLLCDQSRWVRMSAFQALGPFISTFANPIMSGLYCDQDGVHVIDQNRLHELKPEQQEESTLEAATCPEVSVEQCDKSDNMDCTDDDRNVIAEDTEVSAEEVRWYNHHQDAVEASLKSSNDEYGTFQYWRDPLPLVDDILSNQLSLLSDCRDLETQKPTEDIQLDQPSGSRAMEDLASQLESGISLSFVRSKANNDESGRFMFGPNSTPHHTSQISAVPVVTYASVLAGGRNRNTSTGSSGTDSNEIMSEFIASDQDIIPQKLLENYLSMADPSRAQTVDTDIVQHCAYSLPAVALTLGKHNWKCLRPLYEALVSDMQWKVRRTLAYSIHELAVILGPELTHSDLIPIFNGFIKDLDEVRIGVLAHLADFIKLLNKEARRSYLTKFAEFLKTDNFRVWRTRLDLALQLVKICDLYNPNDIVEYLVPLAMQLISDRVADVRLASLALISRILKLLNDSSDGHLRLALISDLIKQLAQSDKWHSRQTYIQLCRRVIMDDSLLLDQFSKELLPSVLTLAADKIPNVRLTVASLFSQSLLTIDYFSSVANPHHHDFIQTSTNLKSDPDRDVKYFANLPSTCEALIEKS